MFYIAVSLFFAVFMLASMVFSLLNKPDILSLQDNDCNDNKVSAKKSIKLAIFILELLLMGAMSLTLARWSETYPNDYIVVTEDKTHVLVKNSSKGPRACSVVNAEEPTSYTGNCNDLYILAENVRNGKSLTQIDCVMKGGFLYGPCTHLGFPSEKEQ